MAKTGPVTALIIAAVLLVIVLIVGYMSLRLFRERHALRKVSEGFSAWSLYRPSCGGYGDADREECRGLSTGSMPSIDAGLIPISWKPCCGSLGVPPPTYTNPFGAREN